LLFIQVIDIDNDGYVSLMDDGSDTRSDIKLPEGELGQEIRSKFENGDGVKVTVLQALGEEAIITCKVENDPRK
jgi:translation initiation factor 5A